MTENFFDIRVVCPLCGTHNFFQSKITVDTIIVYCEKENGGCGDRFVAEWAVKTIEARAGKIVFLEHVGPLGSFPGGHYEKA